MAKEMLKIHEEDKYNDCYGRKRMYMALIQKKAIGEIDIDIPCEATVRKVMEKIGLIHKPKRISVNLKLKMEKSMFRQYLIVSI